MTRLGTPGLRPQFTASLPAGGEYCVECMVTPTYAATGSVIIQDAFLSCRRLSVVTSAFHMPRSRAIFDKCFSLVERSQGSSFTIDFHAASDEGVFTPEVLAARAIREQASKEVGLLS